MSLVKCKECGKEISDTAKLCPNCGVQIKQKYNKRIKIIISVIILIVISVIGYREYQKQELKKLLLEDWERIETGDSGSIYTLELDFSETSIDYNFHSIYSWLDSTLKTYDYEIISSHQLEIDNKKYEIEFNEEKTMMIITPSLTDSNKSENWFNH